MALDTIQVARAEIAQIYIAAFNRVPDAGGLSNWLNQYTAGLMTYAQIAENFTTQPEYTAKYPSIMTNTEYVTEIYNNVFGRTPDAGGLTNWVNQLDATSITHINRGNIMTYMLASAGAAGNTDGERLDNQAAFAVQSILDGVPEATATAQLANITSDDATVTAATTAVSGEAGNVLGSTFTLTKNVDTFNGTSNNDTFVANYDAQATAAHTLGGLDVLNGSSGNDTLAVTSTSGAAFTLAAGTISNIETMTIRGDDSITANVSGSNVTGLTSLSVTQAAGDIAITAATTTDVTVSGLVNADAAAANAIADIAVTGGKTVTITHAGVNGTAEDGITVNGAVNVNVTSTNSLAEDGGIVLGGTTANTGAVTVQASGNGNITAGGGAGGALDTIAVTGGTTISVNQDVTAITNIATAGVAGDVVTQGAVTVTAGNTTTTVTVTQDDQVTAVPAVAAAGVSQTQTVTFLSMLTGESVTVNGLTFTAAKNLTAAEVAAAFANLTNGDKQEDGGPTVNGIYTGANSTAAFTTGAVSGATVTYTEVTKGTNAAIALSDTIAAANVAAAVVATTGVANATAVTGVAGVANGAVVIDDNATKSVTTITVDGYSAGATLGTTAPASTLTALTTLTLKNSGAGAAVLDTLSTGALTLNLVDVDGTVSLDASGAATLTNLTINTSGVASTGAITAAAATTVTINAEAALSGAHVLTAATLIDVNGTAAVNLTGAITNAATLATIDASGNAGGVTAILGATNSVKFTGGTGNDSLTLGAAAIATGKNIDMGAGNDTLVVFASTTAATIVGTVTGGDGTDTLSMGYADAVAVSANTDFDAEVANFERLNINNVVGADDATDTTYTVNLANLTYNYVTVNGTYTDANPEADTLALTGMAASGTVAFGTSTAASLYTVALADATGGTDAINYVLASTGLSVATNVADSTLGTAITAGTITTNAVETFNIASTAVDVDGAQNTITANGNAVTSIVVTGNAGLTLASTATTLTTVDASALTAGTLSFTASNASMTVKGGAGADSITIAATADSGTFYGNGGIDTFAIAASADLVTIDGGAGADIFDFNGVSTNKSNFVVLNNVGSGDKLDFASLVDGTPATTFNSARITLSVGATESTQAYLDQAMTLLAENGFGWFQYNGNTYIAGDVGGADSANSFTDGSDFVVMITGLVDLSTASFNATTATSTLEIA